eukprot:853636-Amphidinium_carterae.2
MVPKTFIFESLDETPSFQNISNISNSNKLEVEVGDEVGKAIAKKTRTGEGSNQHCGLNPEPAACEADARAPPVLDLTSPAFAKVDALPSIPRDVGFGA